MVAAVLSLAGIQLNPYTAFYPKQKDTTENSLTNAEKAQRRKLFFDGKIMNSWRTYQNKPQTSWYVSNGVLGCKYDTRHTYQHTSLLTDKEHKNFELI